MTYEEFFKLTGLPKTTYYRGNYGSWSERNKRVPTDRLEHTWTVGGTLGGSCWDDGTGPDPHYSWNNESATKESEFTALDELLERICPNISMLQYKNLVNNLVKETYQQENEYYGNYTNYGIKTVYLHELYEYLKSKGLLSD